MDRSEQQPLLPGESNGSTSRVSQDGQQYIANFQNSFFDPARRQIRRFLSSKYGHYAVLILVTLDVTCIFADFLISLYICDIECKHGGHVSKNLPEAQEALGIVSLVFSCLFMAELIASVWAFGLRFWSSWFHWLDATIIIAGFIIDVCLKGVLEEVGSVIVILRFWRVFKIVEEFSAGASDRMDALNEKIETLEAENRDLRKRTRVLNSNDPTA